MSIWRAYERMESEAGNIRAAQNVYQRSIRDSMGPIKSDSLTDEESGDGVKTDNIPLTEDVLKKSSSNNEIEFSRWNSQGFGQSSVWVNDGSIEGKVPKSAMKNKAQKPKT